MAGDGDAAVGRRHGDRMATAAALAAATVGRVALVAAA